MQATVSISNGWREAGVALSTATAHGQAQADADCRDAPNVYAALYLNRSTKHIEVVSVPVPPMSIHFTFECPKGSRVWRAQILIYLKTSSQCGYVYISQSRTAVAVVFEFFWFLARTAL